MPSAPVTLRQLVKIYEGKGGAEPFKAVRGIDLEIREGEFMVLVGPSGCGKSTTLRMLAGLEEVTDGEIRIGNKVVNEMEPKERGIAMVFQDYALYPHMTVYGNMAFGLKLANRPKDFIDQKVREAADILGLETLLQRKPRALSGGQRQRVALGRAIVREPSVFLFDEPLSNLDAKMRVQMRTEIAQLHKRLGTTMVYVTHDQVEAMTMGDRICVMDTGEVMQVDTPVSLYREPKNRFVASFIGSPPMNLIEGRIEQNSSGNNLVFIEQAGPNDSLEPIRIPLTEKLSNQAKAHSSGEVTFGIRPDHISEHKTGSCPLKIERPVRVAEPMGNETLLHIQTTSASIIGRVAPEVQMSPGDRCQIWLDLDHAQLFDKASGQVLSLPQDSHHA